MWRPPSCCTRDVKCPVFQFSRSASWRPSGIPFLSDVPLQKQPSCSYVEFKLCWRWTTHWGKKFWPVWVGITSPHSSLSTCQGTPASQFVGLLADGSGPALSRHNHVTVSSATRHSSTRVFPLPVDKNFSERRTTPKATRSGYSRFLLHAPTKTRQQRAITSVWKTGKFPFKPH